MIRLLLPLAIAPTLAACDISNLTDPGAASKAAWEHRQSLIMEPTLPVAEVKPEPECHDHVFRVYRCVDGKIHDWYYE